MERARPSLAIVIGLAGLLLVAQASMAVGKDQAKILDFDTMVGVQGALIGPTNAIRGVNGAGIAWMVEDAKGVLRTNGDLDIKVKGLVFASGANAGSNTIPSFRAIVSCLTTAGAVVNLTTDPFPATQGPATEGGGDAHIKTTVALPEPCVAPIVFVTSPGGSWFTVTGG
jgi:hypothetical protein